jgi:hypothetical protein
VLAQRSAEQQQAWNAAMALIRDGADDGAAKRIVQIEEDFCAELQLSLAELADSYEREDDPAQVAAVAALIGDALRKQRARLKAQLSESEFERVRNVHRAYGGTIAYACIGDAMGDLGVQIFRERATGEGLISAE